MSKMVSDEMYKTTEFFLFCLGGREVSSDDDIHRTYIVLVSQKSLWQ